MASNVGIDSDCMSQQSSDKSGSSASIVCSSSAPHLPQAGVKCKDWMQFTQSKLQILPELQLKRVLKRKNYIMDTNRLCENLTDTDTIPSTARNCRSLYDIRFLNESEYRGIYLVYSYPGSGNTWVRLLMEELSGIFTGSSYHDSKILDTGMLGEGQKLEHVIAVKYHHLYNEPLMDVIIAIVRNPFHALLSRLAFQTTKAHDISFAAGVFVL
jgi:hypothetical protein